MALFSRRVTLVSGQEAFQEELDGYFVDYLPGGPDLVVTFESASGRQDRPDGLRDSWGQKFLSGEALSILAVKPKRVDWYRGADLHAFLRDPEVRRFGMGFERRLFYGSSMGGFGALAFSAALPGSNVLAHAAQSTLAPDLVPWETRFVEARRRDWTGDFRDAADSVGLARRVYVTYDPFFRPDAGHVRRLAGATVRGLRMPFASHATAETLQRLGVMKTVFRHALAGDEGFFPPLARGRRMLPAYHLGLGRHSRSPAVAEACLRRATAIDPDDPALLFRRFQEQFRDGDFTGCLATFERFGGTRHLKNQMKLILLASVVQCHIEVGQPKQARRLLARIKDRHTENDRFHRTLAAACVALGEHDLAADLLARAERVGAPEVA